jgi:hypothetical protein
VVATALGVVFAATLIPRRDLRSDAFPDPSHG